tara:strand:+ start:9964 stop:11301 length:1338 start_codon:yes stop_codon:yes gene_type:complete
MIKPISFCITTANNEKDYVVGLLDSLVNNTEFNKHEILILIDSDNQNTYEKLLDYRKDKPNIKIHKNTTGHRIGYQKNISILFDKASNDVVCYLQSDMVVSPQFDKYFLEALNGDTNRIITMARIEPPIHPESPEKITKSFGLTPDEFKYEEFMEFAKNLTKENRPLVYGHFAPFGLYKQTYFDKIGGFDTQFRCSREDSDFIIRLAGCGLDALETWNASVYHYTCVSSRGQGWYKKDDKQVDITNGWQGKADMQELKRFIRKWGYFGHTYKPKYKNILYININSAPNIDLLTSIEPYFDIINFNEKPVRDALVNLIDFDSHYYTNQRWKYTHEDWIKLKPTFMGQDIQDKLVVTEFNEPLTDLYTKIEVDSYTLEKEINNKENKDFIQNSSAILDNLLKSNPTSYKGTYKIGSFKITINKLVDSNTSHLDNKQYLFNTDKFIFD